MRLVEVPNAAIASSSALRFRSLREDQLISFNPDHVLYVNWDKKRQVIVFINDNHLVLNPGWRWGVNDVEVWEDQ